MGSAPSKQQTTKPEAQQAANLEAQVTKPVAHAGNEERPWGDDPEAELRAALGGLVQVLSSSMGWTWAMVVEVADEGVVVQYGERTRMLAWDSPSKVNPGSMEWMDVLRNAMPVESMMEIYSASFGAWVPAKVVRATPEQVVFQYGERAKLVRLGVSYHNTTSTLRAFQNATSLPDYYDPLFRCCGCFLCVKKAL